MEDCVTQKVKRLVYSSSASVYGDAIKNTIILEVEENKLIKRKNKWVEPKLKVGFGSLYKYAKTVSSASKGCVTDEF